MSEHPELSQLPEDEAYWSALEARIVARLGEPISSADGASHEAGSDVLPFAPRSVDAWAPLTTHAYELAALAVAAAAAVALLVPSPAPLAVSPATNRAAGFLSPPSDEMALVASLTAESPPALGSLVLPVTINPEEESR